MTSGYSFPIFIFVIKMKQLKYTWDIVIERNLSASELKTVNEISQMISCGGEIKELKQKLNRIMK